MTTPRMEKSVLRATAQSARQQLGVECRRAFSAVIVQRLTAMLAAEQAACLLTYRSMRSEVDTSALFSQPVVKLFAPLSHDHQHMEWRQVDASTTWSRGVFGVYEPDFGGLWIPSAGRSILACPLVGFDRSGNRLGMGKGCFDYWLASNRGSIELLVGLAYGCQEVSAMVPEPHDIGMDYIITENEVVQCQML
ncbi:MAG: 5-formyltetrahydrofolate cyclo-ligase [Mariprofundus sp.]|nr:5-formyltetrahydrofolate cyclo-ligase [Mariprofundus sp.]